MTQDNEHSNIESRADAVLKDHNGVYLEKRLFSILKKEFPQLTRNDFQDILDKLLETDYVMQRGLIRPVAHKDSGEVQKTHEGKKSGKGKTGKTRSPDKRGI